MDRSELGTKVRDIVRDAQCGGLMARCVDEILALIQPPQAGGWKKASEVPPHDRDVLVVGPVGNGPFIAICQWRGKRWEGVPRPCNITHWTELPPPPAREEKQDDPRKIAPNGRAMVSFLVRGDDMWGLDNSGVWWTRSTKMPAAWSESQDAKYTTTFPGDRQPCNFDGSPIADAKAEGEDKERNTPNDERKELLKAANIIGAVITRGIIHSPDRDKLKDADCLLDEVIGEIPDAWVDEADEVPAPAEG